MKKVSYTVVVSVILFSLSLTSFARNAVDRTVQMTAMEVTASPAYCIVTHNVGNFVAGISNNGTIGADLSPSGTYDCFTGLRLSSFEFPQGSNTRYLWGGSLWIGGIIGNDTLVSVGQDGWTQGAEIHPDEAPIGNIVYRSTLYPTKPEYIDAVSEQDYVAVYTDTFTSGVQGLSIDVIDGRPHIPLNVEVTQTSYAWSMEPVEDLFIIKYKIRNIGPTVINDFAMGLYVDADVHHLINANGAQDDLTGFVHTTLGEYNPGCSTEYDLNLAWIADNDGDPPGLPGTEVKHVTGLSLLSSPPSSQNLSFNWWISNGDPNLDYGPMTFVTFRDFMTGGVGTPEGDRNKYYQLTNGHFDFDQIYTATIPDDDTIWVTPPASIRDIISTGLDTRYLISIGTTDFVPGQEETYVFAYVAGENLHTDPINVNNLPNDPDTYYSNLDFSDFINNAVMARYLYDNPGVDTDSDGYHGEYLVCNSDTVYISGDGVPDYRADIPPAGPPVWITSLPSGFNVRWNGFESENAKNLLSGVNDFEGYRVNLSIDNNLENFSRVANYDLEDFVQYKWENTNLGWDWVPERNKRYLIEELRCMYAPSSCSDTQWTANVFTRQNPLIQDTDAYYFVPVDCNTSKFGFETPITKVYPNEPLPPYDDPSDVPPQDSALYLTAEGNFKYYEYQFETSSLLPSQEYYVSVTAYDHGSLRWQGAPLESSLTANMQSVVTLPGKGSCCTGMKGNIDNDPNDLIDVGDLIRLIDFLFISHEPLDCSDEANLFEDDNIDIADVTYLIDYLFLSFTPLSGCN